MKLRHETGFDLIVVPYGDNRGHRQVARFICACCGNTRDITVNSAKGLNPEGICNQLKLSGWTADAARKSKTRCPSCRNLRAELQEAEASLRPAGGLATFQPDKGTKPMGEPIPLKMPTVETVVAAATPRQREAIRTELDGCFDADAGCYLDGMTDRKVAEKHSVPMALVKTIREVSFGEERVQIDPRIAILEGDIKAFRELLEEHGRATAALSTQSRDLAARLEVIIKAAQNR